MLAKTPLFVLLMGMGAAAMMVPASFAFVTDDHDLGRPFFYAGVLFAFVTGLIWLATANWVSNRPARDQLLTLLAAFTLLPAMLAVPFSEAVPDTSYSKAYFEMVSSLTTTGATAFDDPSRLGPALHLWRAVVAWLGGLLMLVAAVALLAPMNLAGFEVLRTGDGGDRRANQALVRGDRGLRLRRTIEMIVPLYVLATGLLWLILSILGVSPFLGLCVALSTLSTSGILPGPGFDPLQMGFFAELVVFAFLLLAVSRITLTGEARHAVWPRLRDDRELRVAVIFVTVVPVFLFLRHFLGAIEVNDQNNIAAALRAMWGGLFTVASFLTTTGFVSSDWAVAQAWSGLPTPGLIMAGMAIIGGGVATTAGGVKLLRVYVLYKHGLREMSRLTHPSSVGSAGFLGRDVRREGAFLAWIFFMLFALSIALVTVGLTAAGLDLEAGLIFGIAALSNTGPLAELALPDSNGFAGLNAVAQTIVLVAMVLGRLETLAIVALLNPDFWRR